MKNDSRSIRGYIREAQYSLRALFQSNSLKSKNKNIMVFGLGRTGSSFIGNVLSSSFNIKDCGEIFHYPVFNEKGILKNALRASLMEKKAGIIFKLLTYQIEQNNISIKLIKESIIENNFLIINLTRDPFEQALSVCYSKSKNIWHKKKNNQIYESITIDTKSFIEQLNHLKTQLTVQDRLKNIFKDHIIIRYEDFLSQDSIRENIRNIGGRLDIESYHPYDSSYKRLSKKGVTSRVKNLNSLRSIFEDFQL